MNFNKPYFCPLCRCRVIVPEMLKKANVNCKQITINCGSCKNGKVIIKNPDYKEIKNLEQNELQDS